MLLSYSTPIRWAVLTGEHVEIEPTSPGTPIDYTWVNHIVEGFRNEDMAEEEDGIEIEQEINHERGMKMEHM